MKHPYSITQIGGETATKRAEKALMSPAWFAGYSVRLTVDKHLPFRDSEPIPAGTTGIIRNLIGQKTQVNFGQFGTWWIYRSDLELTDAPYNPDYYTGYIAP